MATEEDKSETHLESDVFRRNAYLIISEMLELSKHTQEDTTVLVDEILHSIFFLGKINNPPYTPDKILDDKLHEVRARYPEPFQRCSSQLPRRSPFSCVLDMIVHLIGQENEEDIKGTLQHLILELREGTKSKCLFSFTLCISQAGENSVRYYGVSMSTSGSNAGKIMVASSCRGAWDECVAGAVMTYFPNKKKNKSKDKKTEIDGTIKLPENVRCAAFSLSDGREMPPCKSCATLFSMETTDNHGWPYGNCAEAECLSNLLKNEARVKKRVQIRAPESWTDEKKEIAEKEVLTHLKNLLRSVDFKWDTNFYTPRRARNIE